MGPAHFFSSGMWIIPLVMMLICFLFFRFGMSKNKGFNAPWQNSGSSDSRNSTGESPLDILKKRYANGEISKEEFNSMKNELS